MARLAAAIAALLLMPVTAQAGQRWTTPASTATSGSCAAGSPCRIDHAINGAAAGDEVVVAPGTYSVSQALSPDEAIDVHGVAGQPRPRLVGSGGTTLLSFKDGGSLRHLALEATGSGQDALTMRGGLAEDLLLTSVSGDGAKVDGAPAGTVLRDSVVRTAAGDDSAAGLKIRSSGSGGDVALVNLTVIATAGSASGVRCELGSGQATFVNTIVRGAVADIAADLDADCAARSSNYRPAFSPGLSAGLGNQQAEPRFADAGGGDYRPRSDSPTVDAGSFDLLLGSKDPAGCSRALGGRPDIGAYEYADPGMASCAWAPREPALSDPGSLPDEEDEEIGDLIRGIPSPVKGRTVVVAPGRGKVLVRRPAGRRFRKLEDGMNVPVGSVVDARNGRVRLVSAVSRDGELQAGTFWGSKFKVRQRRRGRGMTALALRGGNFAACRAPAAAARAAGHRRRRIRRLWGRDRRGRFRTHGHNSVATTRGTTWLTEDRCDGTLTRVRSGAVVVRDRVRHRTVVVRAGHSYLARARR